MKAIVSVLMFAAAFICTAQGPTVAAIPPELKKADFMLGEWVSKETLMTRARSSTLSLSFLLAMH
jgi:hypothetical protein